jgi:DNA polymerase-3 subunit epsilon/exodeoxyribonuclease X
VRGHRIIDVIERRPVAVRVAQPWPSDGREGARGGEGPHRLRDCELEEDADGRREENDSVTGSSVPWQQARLVALDLEGTGAQDHDDEGILEIAVVPLAGGQPDMPSAYCTLVSPGWPVPRRPWISPGLTTSAVAGAPAVADIEPELARRLNGTCIAGLNIGVDWRLLHRRCPSIRPAGLIDTLRLARAAHPGQKANNLTRLLDRYQLTQAVTELAKDSQPHRALWDATGAALLLGVLTTGLIPAGSIGDLMGIGGIDFRDASALASAVVQGELFS